MIIDYSSYNNYTHAVMIFENDGTLIYMNEKAKQTFGNYASGLFKCHYIFRGFNDDCPKFINCVCGRERKWGKANINYLREANTLQGKAFFIIEKRPIRDSSRYMEYLYDITETANSYIENGWMTKDELENMALDFKNSARTKIVI